MSRGRRGNAGRSGAVDRSLLWRAVAVTYLLCLWAASLWPADQLSELNLRPFPDTVEHGIAYFLGVLLVSGAFRFLPLLAVGVGLAAMGALIEGAQAFTATRQFSTEDMVANGLGAGAGILTVAMWRALAERAWGGSRPGGAGRS